MQVDQYGLEVLDPAECRALLATKNVGRVGTSIASLPVIIPMNYVMDGEDIAFRTEPGNQLDKALVGYVVCFEVDDLDEYGQYGWGVSVTGTAEVVRAPEAIARLESMGAPDFLDGRGRWVRIPTAVVVGRRRNV